MICKWHGNCCCSPWFWQLIGLVGGGLIWNSRLLYYCGHVRRWQSVSVHVSLNSERAMLVHQKLLRQGFTKCILSEPYRPKISSWFWCLICLRTISVDQIVSLRMIRCLARYICNLFSCGSFCVWIRAHETPVCSWKQTSLNIQPVYQHWSTFSYTRSPTSLLLCSCYCYYYYCY